jgi:hypothetical protein
MAQLLFSVLELKVLIPKSVMGFKIWFLEISSTHLHFIFEFILFLIINVLKSECQ